MRGRLAKEVSDAIWYFAEGVVFCAVMWITFAACSFTQFWIEDFESLEMKMDVVLKQMRGVGGDPSDVRRDDEYSSDASQKLSAGDRLVKEHRFPPEVATELECIFGLFLRDFVTEWYKNVSDDPEFPASVQSLLMKTVCGIRKRMEVMEKSGGVLRLLNDSILLLRDHLYWYREMRVLARDEIPTLFYASTDESTKSSDETGKRLLEPSEICSAGLLALREDAILEQYRLKRHLHPACEANDCELPYLRMLSSRIIDKLLRPEMSSTVSCDTVRLFLREVLCGTILKSTMDMAVPSEANYWMTYGISLGNEAANAALEQSATSASSATVGMSPDSTRKDTTPRTPSLILDSDSEEESVDDETRVWNFLNPNVDASEASTILSPYAQELQNGTFLLRQADGAHLVLCYVDAGRAKGSTFTLSSDRSVVCETTISCTDGEFRIIFRQSAKGTSVPIEGESYKRLSDLLLEHDPPLTGGLRFARDLYNNRAPVKLVSFPFRRHRRGRRDREDASRKDKKDETEEAVDNLGFGGATTISTPTSPPSATKTTEDALVDSPRPNIASKCEALVASLNRSMEAIILSSVTNPSQTFNLKCSELIDLLVSVDAILSDGLRSPSEHTFVWDVTGAHGVRARGGYAAYLFPGDNADRNVSPLEPGTEAEAAECCVRLLRALSRRTLGADVQKLGDAADDATYASDALVRREVDLTAAVTLLYGLQTVHIDASVVDDFVALSFATSIASSNDGNASKCTVIEARDSGANEGDSDAKGTSKRFVDDAEDSRVEIYDSAVSSRSLLVESLADALQKFIVAFVRADPQPTHFDIATNRRLSSVVLALDAILSNGLSLARPPHLSSASPSRDEEAGPRLVGGYYRFLSESASGSSDRNADDDSGVHGSDGEIARIKRWMCRALSDGSVADRLREATKSRSRITAHYSDRALIANASALAKIVSSVEMLNAVRVRVTWGVRGSDHDDAGGDREERGAAESSRRFSEKSRKSSTRRADETMMMPVRFISNQLKLPFFRSDSTDAEDDETPSLPFRPLNMIAKPLEHDYPLSAVVFGVKQTIVGRQRKKKWLYEISVRCDTLDKEWIVSRRFSYFVNLYRELKRRHPGLRVKAPDKQSLSTFIMFKGRKYGRFVERRRQSLSAFLRELLVSPHTCDDPLVRDFLSPDIKFVDNDDDDDNAHGRDLDASSTDDEVVDEDHESFGAKDGDETVVLDPPTPITPVPSTTSPRSRPRVGAGDVDNVDDVAKRAPSPHHAALLSRTTMRRRRPVHRRRPLVRQGAKDGESSDGATRRSSSPPSPSPSSSSSSHRSNRAKREKAAPSVLSPSAARKITRNSWSLFKELFELYDSSWVYQRTISVVKSMLTTLLEGSTYRSVKLQYESIFSRESALYLVHRARNKLWPNGVWREPPPDYTDEEKAENRRLLMRTLPRAIPGTISSLLGQVTCDDACMKLWEFLQSPTLLKNFAYALLDLLLLHLLDIPSQAKSFRDAQRTKQIYIQTRLLRESNISSAQNRQAPTEDRRELIEQAARRGRARALRRRSVIARGGT
eukprot:g2931.t1